MGNLYEYVPSAEPAGKLLAINEALTQFDRRDAEMDLAVFTRGATPPDHPGQDG
jgi:hypothetical protein